MFGKSNLKNIETKAFEKYQVNKCAEESKNIEIQTYNIRSPSQISNN